MDLKNQQLINNFVKNNNKEQNESFNLVLSKLTEFLMPFFDKISREYSNKIQFKINLIGDVSLKTNFDFLDSSTLMIEYFSDEKSYDFSKKHEEKSEIGKLVNESLHPFEKLIPTIEILATNLYNYLSLNTKDIVVFKRKNTISLKLFDFKLFIFFYNKHDNNAAYNFQIKGKNYVFDFDLLAQNLKKKDKETKGNFVKLIKFYKVAERELALIKKLYSNASKTLYFYENLLYSLPNEVFESKNVFDNFVASFEYLKKILKYDDFDLLKNAEEKPLFVEENEEYQLFAKYYITRNDLKLVLKQNRVFIDNIDKIISGQI